MPASACFVSKRESNGGAESQKFCSKRWGQRWMVEGSETSADQKVQLLISNHLWQIDWLWGISHQVNPGHHFLLHPWPTGKELSAFMYVPTYGDGWMYSYVRLLDECKKPFWNGARISFKTSKLKDRNLWLKDIPFFLVRIVAKGEIQFKTSGLLGL